MFSPREGNCGCCIDFYLSFVSRGSHDSFPAWVDSGTVLSEHISAPSVSTLKHFYSDCLAFTKLGPRNLAATERTVQVLLLLFLWMRKLRFKEVNHFVLANEGLYI